MAGARTRIARHVSLRAALRRLRPSAHSLQEHAKLACCFAGQCQQLWGALLKPEPRLPLACVKRQASPAPALTRDPLARRALQARSGFRKDGNFWVYPEVFRAEIAAGHDWHALADALTVRGLLKRDKDGKVQCPVRDPESGKLIRMMCFAAAIVGEEVMGDED